MRNPEKYLERINQAYRRGAINSHEKELLSKLIEKFIEQEHSDIPASFYLWMFNRYTAYSTYKKVYRELGENGYLDKDSVYDGILGESVNKLLQIWFSYDLQDIDKSKVIKAFSLLVDWKPLVLDGIFDKDNWCYIGVVGGEKLFQSTITPHLFKYSEDGRVCNPYAVICRDIDRLISISPSVIGGGNPYNIRYVHVLERGKVKYVIDIQKIYVRESLKEENTIKDYFPSVVIDVWEEDDKTVTDIESVAKIKQHYDIEVNDIEAV